MYIEREKDLNLDLEENKYHNHRINDTNFSIILSYPPSLSIYIYTIIYEREREGSKFRFRRK